MLRRTLPRSCAPLRASFNLSACSRFAAPSRISTASYVTRRAPAAAQSVTFKPTDSQRYSNTHYYDDRSHNRRNSSRFFAGLGSATIAAAAFSTFAWNVHADEGSSVETKVKLEIPAETKAECTTETKPMDESPSISNWSATHSVTPERYFMPETEEELVSILEGAKSRGETLRVVGTALSPNGLGFSDDGMVNLRMMNKVINLDTKTKQVRVQAGITVRELVDFLEPHGLTLQNFASIDEQQIGGFIQVSAHGTGATVPPVDEQVVSMKLLTPSKGFIELSDSLCGSLFNMAKVALGSLGIVTEVTLQCVPRHQLVERTFVLTRQQVFEQHEQLLRENKHLRYMWIPYSDVVVVVACNPKEAIASVPENAKPEVEDLDEEDPALAARDMLIRTRVVSPEDAASMSFMDVRGALLDSLPNNMESVRKVNTAEAEFWRNSQGLRVGFSDRILGFDCGGQQWVLEVAFPSGTREETNGNDMSFMMDLLELIEKNDIPAPAPIEQRWTARSTAFMSPAYSEDPDALFSWVGIIMYLPVDNVARRDEVSTNFSTYGNMCHGLWEKYQAKQHWAKIERPRNDLEKFELRSRIRKQYPVRLFNDARKMLDPLSLLSNRFIKTVFDEKTEKY